MAPHQIEQVLMNLATNARDAMPNGGRLRIKTARTMLDDAITAEHRLASSGEYALLCASDSGTGMDEDTRRQIFDPFFSTKEVGKGTGLGLAVVYGIIKHHNGCISVDSKPGEGSSFCVYLPLSVKGVGGRKHDLVPEFPIGGTEAILVAEDDATVREMVASLLTGFGYEVIIATNGEEAVRRYLENRQRVKLLLDVIYCPTKTASRRSAPRLRE